MRFGWLLHTVSKDLAAPGKQLSSLCGVKVVVFVFLGFFCSSSSFGRVLYGNPLEAEYNSDLRNTTFEELAANVRGVGNQDRVKSEYLLGLVFTNGNDAWGGERNLEEGRELLHAAWNGGAADAGYTLANIYYKGLGVDSDKSKALEYLTESARMGFLISQRSLGRAYLGGYEEWPGLVDQNIQLGLSWLKSAASSGDNKSARSLASVYAQGKLVTEDFSEVFNWVNKWASSKYGVDVFAFSWLVKLYERGLGTPVDLVQAYKYSDLRGPAGIRDKERLAEQMTDAQIAEAIRQSRAWQEEHNTFVPSYYNLEYQEDGSFR